MCKPKRLIILAPNDRFNYGDLLFSHIIKFELSSYYDDVVNVSTIQADLTKVGGDIVEPLSYIYDLSDDYCNHLIVAGGESFFSNWYFALTYLDKNFESLTSIFYRFFVKINFLYPVFKFSRFYSRLSLKATTNYPYTIGKNEIKNLDRIFYNSLGSSSLKRDLLVDKKNIQILNSVDYLSVRDVHSNNLLNEYGFNSYLFPDCAIKMSEFYDSNFLLKNSHTDIIDYSIQNRSKYLVFQVNKSLGKQYFNEIVNFLDEFYKKYGISICLCPIGFAQGHEDDVILEEISRDLKEKNIHFFFSRELNIWDIMMLISNSTLYIGTSLHGAITAMSYKVPYLGLFVNKTHQYINKWGLGEVAISEDLNVFSKIDFLLNNPDLFHTLSENYENQKSSLNNSFSMMKKIINSNDF